MAGKRHDEGRVCLCDRPDGSCVGLAVRRLSQERVQELAEEIWAASTGDLLAARPLPDSKDPRSSRAGASAQAAYRRRRAQDRQRWRPALVWLVLTWGLIGAAPAAGLLLGMTVGAWLGWPAALLVAALAWSRLRFRSSAEVGIWQQQAAMQRRTAGLLGALEAEGCLVLHDVTLPGWLGSLEHLVVGPSGVWVIGSWQRQGRRPGTAAVPAGILRELRSHTQAIAEVLDGWAQVPIRSLLGVHGAWPRTRPTLGDIRVTAARQLVQVVRCGSPVAPGEEVERATSRLLEVLRPAA
jgi:hypothetical protein